MPSAMSGENIKLTRPLCHELWKMVLSVLFSYVHICHVYVHMYAVRTHMYSTNTFVHTIHTYMPICQYPLIEAICYTLYSSATITPISRLVENWTTFSCFSSTPPRYSVVHVTVMRPSTCPYTILNTHRMYSLDCC